MNFNIVNFDKFVDQYMGNQDEAFIYENKAIQVYPLSLASKFITLPTPLFRTEYNFLLLIAEGGGRQQVDNKMLDLSANDALFIREGHLNGIQSIDPSTKGYYIYIDNEVLHQVFSGRSLLNRFTFNPKHSIEKLEMEWLCQCCNLLMAQEKGIGQSMEAQASLVKAMVLKLAEKWPTEQETPDRQSEITMLFKELLYEHFIEHRELKFYAESLAVSENYLNRCVKSVTAKPPKQLINAMVINHSKVLLQNRSYDISQIAFDLNFSDPSYFGRLFKQLTNQTPSAYRNTILQD